MCVFVCVPQVCVQEKVRQLDNAEFRELQVLHEETQLRLREVSVRL